MKEFRIKKNEAGQRFDKYLAKLLPCAPKSFLYRMLRKKNIVLNGGKAQGPEIIREGDLFWRTTRLTSSESILVRIFRSLRKMKDLRPLCGLYSIPRSSPIVISCS